MFKWQPRDIPSDAAGDAFVAILKLRGTPLSAATVFGTRSHHNLSCHWCQYNKVTGTFWNNSQIPTSNAVVKNTTLLRMPVN